LKKPSFEDRVPMASIVAPAREKYPLYVNEKCPPSIVSLIGSEIRQEIPNIRAIFSAPDTWR
jgi:hypothetical protein